MEKEIKSREKLTLNKDKGEVRIKTSIDNLISYNQKIIQKRIYLVSPEDTPFEFTLIAKKNNNLGFIKIKETGPQEYTIKENTLLGTIIEKPKPRRAKRSKR